MLWLAFRRKADSAPTSPEYTGARAEPEDRKTGASVKGSAHDPVREAACGRHRVRDLCHARCPARVAQAPRGPGLRPRHAPTPRSRYSRSIRSGPSRCPITGFSARSPACGWTHRITSGSCTAGSTRSRRAPRPGWRPIPPTAETCCAPAPPVLEFDQAGTLINSLGRSGPGIRMAADASRDHRRRERKRVDRRARAADPLELAALRNRPSRRRMPT